jgi:glycosyltransferase involved in cell wall biosynthesis
MFCAQEAGSFDLVFEKGWRLSGFLAAAFIRQGVPAVLVENDVSHWSDPLRGIREIAKYGAHRVAQYMAAFYSRQTARIIAETDELKTMLVNHRGIAPEQVAVVGLGVDHNLFRTLDQAASRHRLEIGGDAVVLLYVGGMDTYHDVGPVIDALAHISAPSLQLHLVGDGEYRGAYEMRAKDARVPVRFHGQVPHERVPEFIAAADLCLAPYRVSAFPNESVCFSTLKIPEYMACARPVVSVPSGHIKKLIEDQVSGFLIANDMNSWISFFERLPSRERLGEMGRLAALAAEPITWERTAQRYLAVCEELVAQRRSFLKARADSMSSRQA